MNKTTGFTLLAALLYVSSATAGLQASGATTVALEDQIKSRPRLVDAGDFYWADERAVHLMRVPDEIVVGITADADSEEVVRHLTEARGPLAGFKQHAVLGKRAVSLTGGGALLDSADAHERVRAATGVSWTAPVFFLPATATRVWVTDEVVVALKSGVDPDAFLDGRFAAYRRLPGTDNQYIATLAQASDTATLQEADSLRNSPEVDWASPNFYSDIRVSTNDSLYGNQWHLDNTGQTGARIDADVDAPEAWTTTTGSPSVVIAVVDNGVQINHPDLAANIFVNAGEVPGNGIDDDGNGWVDDVNGWDFVDNDNNPNPAVTCDNHGTAVAGVAAAAGGNALGVTGACQSCKILPIKIAKDSGCTGGGFVSDAQIASAIYYAAGRTADGLGTWGGADLLNDSWGGGAPNTTLTTAFAWAASSGRNGLGVASFNASGNSASAYSGYQLTGITAGTWLIEWRYAKNGSVSAGDDTIWLANVGLPDGTVERFDTLGLPSGWSTSGSSSWAVVDDPAHPYGTGRYAAKAGAISNNQTTVLRSRSVTVTSTAALTFRAWVSSESNDKLSVYVSNNGGASFSGPFFGANGVPAGVIPSASYPASLSSTLVGVMAVGAATDWDYRSDYSQYGSALDFVAPSSGGFAGISTTDRTGSSGYNSAGDYTSTFGGTSSATPLAAGIAGLMLSANPSLTAADLKNVLRSTADKIGAVTYASGFNQFYGYGRINASAAVAAAANLPSPTSTASPTPPLTGTPTATASTTSTATTAPAATATPTSAPTGTPTSSPTPTATASTTCVTFRIGVCCTDSSGTTCSNTVCTANASCTAGPFLTCAGASADDGRVNRASSTVYPPNTAIVPDSTVTFAGPQRSRYAGPSFAVQNALIRFNTGPTLPDNATVSSAALTVQLTEVPTNADALNLTGDWFDWGPSVGAEDFSHNALSTAFSVPVASLTNGSNTVGLSATAANVSLTGYTYLRTHLSQRAADAAPVGINLVKIALFDHPTLAGPALQVCYALPGATPTETATASSSFSPTPTSQPSSSPTLTATATASVSPTDTVVLPPSSTPTPTFTPTLTPTHTPTAVPPPSATPTATPTATAIATCVTFRIGVCCTDSSGTSCANTVCTANASCTAGPFLTCAGASADDGRVNRASSTVYPPNTAIVPDSTVTFAGPQRSRYAGPSFAVQNALIRFNTGPTLPDNATVSSAALTVQLTEVPTNADALNLTGDWFDWGPSVGAEDFSHNALSTAFSVPVASLTNGSNTVGLSATAANVSLTGYTYLRTHLSQRAADAAPAGINLVKIALFDHPTLAGPALQVCYALPGATPTETATASSSSSPTPTSPPSPSPTLSATATASLSPTDTVVLPPSSTPTPTFTPTLTPTRTPTAVPPPSATPTATPTATAIATCVTFRIGVCCTDSSGTSCANTVCTANASCTAGPFFTCAGASADDGRVNRASSTVYPPNTAIVPDSTVSFAGPQRSRYAGPSFAVQNALIRFNTGPTLPDNATVSSAALTVQLTEVPTNADALNLTGDWFDWGPSVGAEDFSHNALSTAFSVPIGSLANGSNTVGLSATAANVSLTGYTYLRTHISQRAADAAPAGINLVKIALFDHPTLAGPALQVCYTP